jgi:ABC-2 type transport system ATP-binding protein
LIGLVPQELTLEVFATVRNTIAFSRGLFGLRRDPALHRADPAGPALALPTSAGAQLRTLSGGMKRRVMIAKALAHEPRVLFLDEPTAGVDVELRKDMWRMVEGCAPMASPSS